MKQVVVLVSCSFLLFMSQGHYLEGRVDLNNENSRVLHAQVRDLVAHHCKRKAFELGYKVDGL